MIIGRTEYCMFDWTVGVQSNRKTKKFLEWEAWRLMIHSRQYYGYHTIDTEIAWRRILQWRNK